MKKILSLMLTVVLLTASFAITSYAHDETAEAAYGTAVVDGKKDSAYDAASPIEIKAFVNASYPNNSTGKVWVLWDDANLYFYAEIADTNIDTANPTVGAAWQRDCLGLTIDYSYDRNIMNSYENITGNDMYAGYLNIVADGEVEYHNIFDTTAAKAVIKTNVVKSAAGYIVEVSVPLLHKASFKAGDKIGLDFYVHNADGEGKRQSETRWNIGGELSWQRTDTMGTLTLGAKTEAATTAAITTAAPAGTTAGGSATPNTADYAGGTLIISAAALLCAATVIIIKKRGIKE